jgi:hypothetical protein
MKKIVILSTSLLLLLSCKKETKDEKGSTENGFIIKGKFVASCDNPTPLTNATVHVILTIPTDNYTQVSLYDPTTDGNGNFTFTYSDKAADNLSISISNDDRSKSADMKGIPPNRNVDLGNLYWGNNMYAILKVIPQTQTSKKDTIYYDLQSTGKYNKQAVGPFSSNQVLDSLFFHDAQNYDVNNAQPSQQKLYWWKLGKNGAQQGTVPIYLETCKKWNEFVIAL